MIQNPLISIIIPAYNAENFITKTLDSVLAQTYKNYELIVVDDGSSDKTAEVVDKYLKKNDMRGLCIRQQNKKIAGARNTGIRAASGSWIALLDHDDLWFPQKLQSVVEAISLNQNVDLVCHSLIVKSSGKSLGILRCQFPDRNLSEWLLFKCRSFPPSATVFKKEAAKKIGLFCENPNYDTSEDLDFWIRLSRIAVFVSLNQELGEYHLVPSGASQKIIYHTANALHVLNTHLAEYLDGKLGRRKQLQARRRVAMVYRSALRNLTQNQSSLAEQREFAKKMINTYAYDIKNIVTYIAWYLGKKI